MGHNDGHHIILTKNNWKKLFTKQIVGCEFSTAQKEQEGDIGNLHTRADSHFLILVQLPS